MKHFTIFMFAVALFAQSAVVAAALDAAAGTHDESWFKGGTIHLIQEAHQDVGWEPAGDKNGSIETDSKADVRILEDALSLMKKNQGLTFMWEDMIGYDECLRYKPEMMPDLKKAVEAGRLPFGACYTQPFESTLINEVLVRQLYFGKRRFDKLFSGETARTMYSFDVPGRTMQMPQLLAKSGVPYAAFSRLHGSLATKGIPDRSIFSWASPDGSAITCWSTPHYCELMLGRQCGGGEVSVDNNNIQAIKRFVDMHEKYWKAKKLPKHIAMLLSLDYRAPLVYDDQIAKWNQWAGQNGYPLMKYSTFEGMLDAVSADLKKGKTALDVAHGERPNFWVYENVVCNESLMRLQREAGFMLPCAEAFSVFKGLESGSLAAYPAEELSDAYKAATTADHSIQHNRYVLPEYSRLFGGAAEAGNSIFKNSALGIAETIKFSRPGVPVVVFNPLSWTCDDLVELETAPTGSPFVMTDAAGKNVSCQYSASGKLLFVAKNIPSFGYGTYYLIGDGPVKPASNMVGKKWTDPFENKFFRISPARGGIRSVFDKESGREIFNTEKFLGGELLELDSRIYGAMDHRLPFEHPSPGYDQTEKRAFEWICTEGGDVYTAFVGKARLTHCEYDIRVVVYHDIKRVDFEPTIIDYDGTVFREFRLLFPVNSSRHDLTYDVPFGLCKIGVSECNPEEFSWGNRQYPREVQNFMYAGGDGFGVTVASSVGGVGYVDPTVNPVGIDMIQPMLFASRQQGCGDGGFWNNRGTHKYRFGVFAHSAGVFDGWRSAVQFNTPMLAVVPRYGKEGSQPETKSFCRVSPSNIVVSTIKQTEDDDSVVVRLFDVIGSNTVAKLTFGREIQAAFKTDLLEEHPQVLKHEKKDLLLPVTHHSIETVKIEFKNN